MQPLVRPATLEDTDKIAEIHREAFIRQTQSQTWVRATLSAYPRMLCFVLLVDDEIAGFIFWAQKSGIRPAVTLELDQVAVRPQFQGQGLGALLIRTSLAHAEETLKSTGQSLKSVLVTTRADNAAQQLYTKVLGAREVARIDDLYSATEVIMLADMRGGVPE